MLEPEQSDSYLEACFAAYETRRDGDFTVSQWLTFMITVCMEHPFLPEEVQPLLDAGKAYHIESDAGKLDMGATRVAAWQHADLLQTALFKEHHKLASLARYRSVQLGADARPYDIVAANYHATRGLICLLWTKEKIENSLDEKTYWFMRFMTDSVEILAPEFQQRMTQLMHECL